MNIIGLLNELRNALIYIYDVPVIVRLDLDEDTPDGLLKLVVIMKGKYIPYLVDDSDFRKAKTTIRDCILRIERDFPEWVFE